jgi:hypothetical protein
LKWAWRFGYTYGTLATINKSEFFITNMEYKEHQSMKGQEFVYIPIGITSLLILIVVAKTNILLAFLIPASLFLLTGFIVKAVKMDLVFNESGISIKLFKFNPSHNLIQWDQIESFSFDSLNPLDYGGYGLRYTGSAKGYIVEGKNVLKINLKNGSNIHLSVKYMNKTKEVINEYLR